MHHQDDLGSCDSRENKSDQDAKSLKIYPWMRRMHSAQRMKFQNSSLIYFLVAAENPHRQNGQNDNKRIRTAYTRHQTLELGELVFVDFKLTFQNKHICGLISGRDLTFPIWLWETLTNWVNNKNYFQRRNSISTGIWRVKDESKLRQLFNCRKDRSKFGSKTGEIEFLFSFKKNKRF